VGVGFDFEIGVFDVGGRRAVAAVEPDEQAGVVPQAQHLVVQGRGGDGQIGWGPVLPVLPVVAAAPAEHHEDTLLVGEVKELLGFKFAFQANGVEVHLADELELLAQAFGVGAQQHVLRPAGAADEDAFAVDAEESAAVVGEL